MHLVLFFQGCGKSAVVKEFAELLGYHIEPIMLYQVCSCLLPPPASPHKGNTFVIF